MGTAPFSPERWFSEIIGMDERTGVFKKIHLASPDEKAGVLAAYGGLDMEVLKTPKGLIGAGKFDVKTLRELSDQFNPSDSEGGGTLNILTGHGDPFSVRVPYAMALDENDGATWLVASNYNCLEFVDPKQTAEHGVTNYVYDRTQGPYASLACAGALIYRNYFVNGTGQLKGQEVNLLKETPLADRVQHGYCVITQADVPNLPKDEEWLFSVAVGVHKNCQITTTQLRDGKFEFVPPGRMCHCVFAAALDFAGSVVQRPETGKIGREVLRAQYMATILAAWQCSKESEKGSRAGAKRVFLTLLGGGVFANPLKFIVDAILGCAEYIVRSGLQVYVVMMNHKIPDDLRELVQSTGGTIDGAPFEGKGTPA